MYNKSNTNYPLFQFSVGERKALGIGYSRSVGGILNLNNIWDSGVSFSLGLGLGVEQTINVSGNIKLNETVKLATSTIDFTKPTSTADIEGASLNCYTSAGLGISVDMNNKQLKGIQIGTIGGGVYYEQNFVLTLGSIGESLYNTGPFILNSICKETGMNRFVAFNYIELDGK